MKSYLRYIPVLFIMVLTFFTSCNNDDEKLIPRGRLSMIYAEMLATDQWVINNPDLRTVADTSLVYEPILKKYGYDSEDYRYSVDVYMDDPERFSRIFRAAAEILNDEIIELKRLKKEQEDAAERLKMTVMIDMKSFFPYLGEEPYVHYYDSLDVVYDSTATYKIMPIERADTIYDRIEMIIRVDSLSVTDSLHVVDSIMIADTLVGE